MNEERLQKVMAARGVASRRACEELIEAGRVMVDGQVVTRLGTKVSPDADIKVDGEAVKAPRKAYFMLNKPRGYVTTLSDEADRKSISDIIRRIRTRVFPVGRLDLDSEGLLLLTNDGELANLLTHPRYEIEKSYLVKTRGRMDDETIDKLRKGIHLREGKATARVRVVRRTRNTSELMMTISRGYNRQIRRMCAAVGHEAMRLKRVRFGPLRLEGVSRGTFRRLKAEEVSSLVAAAEQARERFESKK